MLMPLHGSVIPSPPTISPLQAISLRILLLLVSFGRGMSSLQISTPMEQEEAMMRLWLEEPSLTLE